MAIGKLEAVALGALSLLSMGVVVMGEGWWKVGGVGGMIATGFLGYTMSGSDGKPADDPNFVSVEYDGTLSDEV